LNQLARVTALEWGRDGIRVNTVHPNQVSDSVHLVDDPSTQRGNVLNAEVTSRDVADVICELLGPRFRKTTGAQIAVDGGSDRII
jgi:NAD(P)-dependent dehydrogenase (short-subunit alcohol dehydrogenase family)